MVGKSVWDVRRRNVLFQPPEPGDNLGAHGMTRASVHALVLARLAAKVMDPLSKMDVLRPNDKNSEALDIIKKCHGQINNKVLFSLKAKVSPVSLDALPEEEERVNTPFL